MGLLNSAMQGDNLGWNDTDAFAEAATYTKKTGVTRSITAIATFDPPMRKAEVEMGVATAAIISVDHSATTGITFAELDTGDKITCTDGVETRTYMIGKSMVASKDAGRMEFRINRD